MRCFTVAACLVAALSPIRAEEYRWLSKPTSASSPELVKTLGELTQPRLSGVSGILVQDLHWRADDLDVHLISGVLYIELPLEGYPIGAYFAGQARVSFSPVGITPRRDLRYWFGADSLDLDATELYFFTLRGASVAEQVGATGLPSTQLPSSEGYEEMKAALGQLGGRPLHAFLNRDGRAKGLAYVIVNAPKIRIRESKHALLLYSFEPDEQQKLRLRAVGHVEVASKLPYKMFWKTLCGYAGQGDAFQPAGDVKEYAVDLRTGSALDSAEETTSITFKAGAGVSALALDLTPQLEVQKITGPDGATLAFLQWSFLKTDPNYDRHVLVSIGAPAATGADRKLVVTAKGRLFEPFFFAHYLEEEDDWLPTLDDPTGALYDIRFTVPADQTAVAPGRLLEDVVEGEWHRHHFRGERPQKAATVYFGKFLDKEGQADGTTIRLYGDDSNPRVRQNIDYCLQEITNSYNVFTSLFGRLDTPLLRVVGTPTDWGRGFDGLVLLGSRAGFGSDSSFSDVFRAHEVAHQWWGNLVQPRNWPEDRWLSESFAEYAAFEYYRNRFKDPAAQRRLIESWAQPVLEASTTTVVRLNGDTAKMRRCDIESLAEGGASVYNKGPLVLHMLRFMFRLVKGSDDAFWSMLKDFAAQHRYATVSTGDFTAHATKALGVDIKWFWDQWVYRAEIPVVEWSSKITPKDGKYLVEVVAEQKDTDFMLSIPVHIKFPGDRGLIRPLALKGQHGQLQAMVPEKPSSIALNDLYEALVILREKQ